MPPDEEQYDPDGDLPVQGGIRGLEPPACPKESGLQHVSYNLSFSPWLFYHIFRSVLIEYQHILPKIDSTIGGILFRRLAKDYRIKDAFPSFVEQTLF